MLSDVCSDALVELWESGAPDLALLRRDILNYTVEPFNYPKKVTDILLAAVNETARHEDGDDDAICGPLGLMALLLCTLRAYDTTAPNLEENLERELETWWPRAGEAVARLPPPTEEELSSNY